MIWQKYKDFEITCVDIAPDKKAMRFRFAYSIQKIWIPKTLLEEDGTIKSNADIDFCFRNTRVTDIARLDYEIGVRRNRKK